jgi:hypothetical protein
MNGLKLAAAVRDRWPPVNIVITTGKARPPNDPMPTNSRFMAKPHLTLSSRTSTFLSSEADGFVAKSRSGVMPGGPWDKLPDYSGSIHHLRD